MPRAIRPSFTLALLVLMIAPPSRAQTTGPADQQAIQAAVVEHYTAVGEFAKALPADALRSPQRRRAAAPQAVPAIKRLIAAWENLARATGKPEAFSDGLRVQYQAMLLALEDADTLAAVGRAGAEDRVARLSRLAADYITGDAGRQAALVVELEAMLRADPKDPVAGPTGIYLLRGQFADDPTTSRLRSILERHGLSVAPPPAPRKRELDPRLAGLVGKPLVIEGALPDGSAFSSAQWKGKVVLVDFWATWCGPCVAELPRVKHLYRQYHQQGLEIVAVSNDRSVQALTPYLAKDAEMSWPNLIDLDAASTKQWHPLSRQFGINAIPRMLLIDRHGICRTVEARSEMEELIPKLLAEPAE